MNDVIEGFIQACLKGDLNTLNNLLRRKEEIDVKQLERRNLLLRAVMYGQSEIVRLLLTVGVNVNQSDSFLRSRPLHFACREGNLSIVELLLENGADIDAIIERLNCTALDIAVLNKKTSITKLLLKNGCKTNVRNHKGQTALELALNKGYLVKQLAFKNKCINLSNCRYPSFFPQLMILLLQKQFKHSELSSVSFISFFRLLCNLSV